MEQSIAASSSKHTTTTAAPSNPKSPSKFAFRSRFGRRKSGDNIDDNNNTTNNNRNRNSNRNYTTNSSGIKVHAPVESPTTVVVQDPSASLSRHLHEQEQEPHQRPSSNSSMESSDSANPRRRQRQHRQPRRGSFLAMVKTLVTRRRSHLQSTDPSAPAADQHSERDRASPVRTPLHRRSTMDNANVPTSVTPVGGVNINTSNNSSRSEHLRTTVPLPSLLSKSAHAPHQQQQQQQHTRRRSTMDVGMTTTATSTSSLNENKLHSLQAKAEEFTQLGDHQSAIDCWIKTYPLAHTLSVKTKILCTILNLCLHVQDMENATLYLHMIRPTMVKQATWLETSLRMYHFLHDQESYELALLLANELQGKDAIPLDTIANLQYQLAQQKLQRKHIGEALQYLQKSQELLNRLKQDKDELLYQKVLQSLGQVYIAQQQYTLALQVLQELITYTDSKHDKAKLYCQIANHVHVPMDRLDMALECLQLANDTVNSNSNNDVSGTSITTATRNRESIQLQMYQTKADILFRLGRTEQALLEYEKAYKFCESMQKHVLTPSERAKILYTMGRICCKLQRPQHAIQYFTKELNVTQTALGTSHLSVSRVHHELAKIYDEKLNDHNMALQHYEHAIQIEQDVLSECHDDMTACVGCNKRNGGSTSSTRSIDSTESIVRRPCPRHAALQHDCIQQIHETKNCQGRIHFKLGDFSKALQTSLHHTATSHDTDDDEEDNIDGDSGDVFARQ